MTNQESQSNPIKACIDVAPPVDQIFEAAQKAIEENPANAPAIPRGSIPPGFGGPPPLALAAAGLTVGALTLLAAGAIGWLDFSASTQPVTYDTGTVAWWVPVLVLSLVCAAVPYSTGIAAVRRLGSRLAAFVALLEVVAALLFAWLLLGEWPLPLQLLGGALILMGVALLIFSSRRIH